MVQLGLILMVLVDLVFLKDVVVLVVLRVLMV